jgi:hypothetical protein
MYSRIFSKRQRDAQAFSSIILCVYLYRFEVSFIITRRTQSNSVWEHHHKKDTEWLSENIITRRTQSDSVWEHYHKKDTEWQCLRTSSQEGHRVTVSENIITRRTQSDNVWEHHHKKDTEWQCLRTSSQVGHRVTVSENGVLILIFRLKRGKLEIFRRNFHSIHGENYTAE